ELEINIVADLFLPREDAKIIDLTLSLFKKVRLEVADAVDGEPEARGLASDLRDLKIAARRTEHGGQPRRRIDDTGNIGKPFWLLGVVVDRIEGGGRVLDPFGTLQILAGGVEADL